MKPIIIKLKNQEWVIGVPKKETEKGIDLDDVLIIKYDYNELGYPIMYFGKYSLFTKSFDVFFSMNDIMHVFRDPIKNIISYYETNIGKLKEIARDDIPITRESEWNEEHDKHFDEYDEESEKMMEEYLKKFMKNGPNSIN